MTTAIEYLNETNGKLRREVDTLRAEQSLLHTQVQKLRDALEGVMYWDNGKPEWETARQTLKGTPT